MAKWDLDAVDKLEEINRLQAQTIERQAAEIGILRSANAILHNSHETQAEMIRQAQQALRNARDSALEDSAKRAEIMADKAREGWADDVASHMEDLAQIIRSLKSTTQGSRE